MRVLAMDLTTSDIMQFPSSHDEPCWWYAFCVNIHDKASNEFKETGIRDMIKVAVDAKARAGECTWEQVSGTLSKFFGKGKQM